MNSSFFKFPSTPHLALLGELEVRRDKVMGEAERESFLRNEIVVEEKVDGANLGISFDSQGNLRVQNRGAYLELPGIGQWKKLDDWLKLRIALLCQHLSERYILFGEWCYARHSVPYNRLPDWFLGFDIYDKRAKKFFSCARRDEIFRALGLAAVPRLKEGRFSLSELSELLQHSRVGEVSAEGLYLRVDQGEWLLKRAKLVRPAFVQSIEKHWSRGGIKPNQLELHGTR